MAKELIARLARQHGPKLIDHAVGRLVADSPKDAAKDAPAKKPSLSRRIAGGILIRIATKSVPGAIIVGGGLLAKHLHGKRQEQRRKAGLTPPKA